MITLKVEEYCHDCPDFEPEVIKHKIRDEINFVGDIMMNTHIYCQHAARCRAVKRYLEKQKGEKA